MADTQPCYHVEQCLWLNAVIGAQNSPLARRSRGLALVEVKVHVAEKLGGWRMGRECDNGSRAVGRREDERITGKFPGSLGVAVIHGA